MISNIESFLLDQASKETFWMSLFKILLRLIHETEKKSETIKLNINRTFYNEIK